MFVPMIVHTTSAAICYYFSRISCKLCMQGFSFSLPLTVITPATAAVFCYLCDLQHVNITLLKPYHNYHKTCRNLQLSANHSVPSNRWYQTCTEWYQPLAD